MSKNKKTFEENLAELETTVQRLESGDIALEEALSEFQKGMILSKELQATLAKAEETLVKVMQEDGTETEFNG
ncbi:exodeoxyribonuclease VII small subunit [Streptococcus moroccensis]|uniref:Exodeoxyribonuclease 7 small subunit n=1 Tax=Streptococcus moroccensis TaxID=1451356 RepID=A0ABT9YU04_9STRE|nr:exodeoxyribonuclease VII small subunit [Streptococcus moroccensis]MDQ0223480.1 exodeoxyribonuclease VII small subunit [Streptococcus moroccensis]